MIQLQYRRLGSTGLEVSRICLGGSAFGEPERGDQPWSLGASESGVILRAALELGINFFDTANVYSAGSSEEILGEKLLKLVKRDEVVIATKVHDRVRPGPNGAGLSRKAVITEVERSLKRIGTDYIDLYQIHRFDPETPLEETLEVLNDLVRAGKVLYLGASSMFAWQFARVLHTAQLNGWTPFVSMQNHYNLIYREEEREMIPLCLAAGVGLVPWSPLARGRLARPWGTETARSGKDELLGKMYGADDSAIVEAVGQVASRRGVPRSQIALAWLLSKPGVVAPILGATNEGQLRQAVGAMDITLTAEEFIELEEPYWPHGVGWD